MTVKGTIEGMSMSASLLDKTKCKETYGNMGGIPCPKVKADLDCSWSCALAAISTQHLVSCNSATKCSPNSPGLSLSCSSVSEMFTAVCDKTTDEIKTIVAGWKAGGDCADDGVAFSPFVQTSPPVQTTPAPAAFIVAPADTKHFVMLTVTLPYTKADFDQAKQDKYKTAMAATAGTSYTNVDIKKVTEKLRRAGSVDVETVVENARLVPFTMSRIPHTLTFIMMHSSDSESHSFLGGVIVPH